MSARLLLVLAGLYVAGLMTSALLLWVSCKIFRVRYPSEGDRPAAGVGFGRALALTALLALLDAGLAVTLLALTDSLPVAVALFVGPWLLLPVVVFRLGLPVDVWRAVGIDLVWNLLKVVPAVLTALALKAFVFEATASGH